MDQELKLKNIEETIFGSINEDSSTPHSSSRKIIISNNSNYNNDLQSAKLKSLKKPNNINL